MYELCSGDNTERARVIERVDNEPMAYVRILNYALCNPATFHFIRKAGKIVFRCKGS